MNYNVVLHTIGTLLSFLGLSMIFPLSCALYCQEEVSIYAFLSSIIITILCGLFLRFSFKGKGEIGRKEGLATVTLGWIVAAAFGTFPFLFSGTLNNFIDAYFESMSGFTTTGATVLKSIEGNPLSILFWRNQIQWMGGMGIIVLIVAILPTLGVGGVQLFKSEVPGPEPDKLKPRITETAKILYLVYITISAFQIVCLYFSGMSLYDAIIHMFGTVATGGFSSNNLSIGHYNNHLAFEIIIIFFMLVVGTNFTLLNKALHGDIKGLFRDREFIFYISVVGFSIVVITTQLHTHIYNSILTALRYASFQVVSIITTTGFITTDFDQWPTLSKSILIMLMFIGGCASSTSGGIKSIRILILIKSVVREFKKILHPHAIIPIFVGDKKISDEAVNNATSFFLLYILIFALGSLIMIALGLDMVSALSSVAATLGNVGPGLVLVGPSQNYAFIPSFGKIFLCFCMLLGRLEIYAVLTLFIPEFWKK